MDKGTIDPRFAAAHYGNDLYPPLQVPSAQEIGDIAKARHPSTVYPTTIQPPPPVLRTLQCHIPPEIILSNQTYLNFLRPDLATFDIEVIAAGLSKVCRWGAQCDDFYSVAQHSVLVSMVVPRDLALWGLLHDASEGLMGLDMTSPLKQLCPEFKAIEKRVEEAVFERFCIYAHDSIAKAQVKRADRVVEATERRDLMGSRHNAEHSQLVKDVLPLADLRIEPWDHRKAKRMFLVCYQKIMGLDHDPRAGSELARLHAMVR